MSANGQPEGDDTGVPKHMLDSGLSLYGARVNPGPPGGNKDPKEKIENLRAFKLRDDDIMVQAFPKCGTHWLWEVTRMLLDGNADISTKVKEFNMLDMGSLEDMDKLESPRIFNSHLFFGHMPQEIFTRKNKIIHIVRNPKDAFTSWFYHMQNHHTGMSFDALLQAYMEDKMNREHQLAFLRHMHEFQVEHPDHPVLTVYYEDMKQDPVKGITELAAFLGVPDDKEFFQKIAEATSFQNMKSAESGRVYPERKNDPSKKRGKPNFYRKGQIGDWKNNFTVAQNEQFDAFLERESKGLPYKFVYGD